MRQLIQKVAGKEGQVDLNLLGIPNAWKMSGPSKTTFPPAFDPALKKVWAKTFKHGFDFELKQIPSPQDRWNEAVKEFLRLARRRTLLDSQLGTKGDPTNGMLKSKLQKERRGVEDVLKSLGLGVAEKTVSHEVESGDKGFRVKVRADLKHEQSVEDLRNKLHAKRFITRGPGQVLEYKVSPGTVIRFDTNRAKQSIEVDVVLEGHPYLRSMIPITHGAYQKYVLESLWNKKG